MTAGKEQITIDTTDAYRRSWQAALAHFAECLVSANRSRPLAPKI